MIGSIRGKVILKDESNLVIEAGGVGYRVLVSEKLYSKTNLNEEISLFIFTHVKEDALDLFGFLELADLKLFKNLISVNGVGPRTAMTIFSFSTRQEIVDAVLKGDVSFFTRIPRLGKKNAQKIIIELKSKFKDDSIFDLNAGEKEEDRDVIDALKTFGFSHKEITEVLKNIDSSLKSDEKIRLALKYLGK
jgi:holliday junction DNA helicase RuvA